jgi:hypothetical protein
MVERDLAKVDTGVRFPSPAPSSSKTLIKGFFVHNYYFAYIFNNNLQQMIQRVLEDNTYLMQKGSFLLFCSDRIYI